MRTKLISKEGNSADPSKGEACSLATGRFNCLALIARIEKLLIKHYELSSLLRAGDFLIDDKGLADFKALEKFRQPKARSRAGLWLFRPADSDEVFLGLHVCEGLLKELSCYGANPRLTRKNLDLFCVLIEEVSHFHLVVERISTGRSVSELELEWQAEVDKTLISGLILKEQNGHAELKALSRIIYGSGITFVRDERRERYELANWYAAKFWSECLRAEKRRNFLLHDAHFLKLTRDNYQKPMEEKFPFSLHDMPLRRLLRSS